MLRVVADTNVYVSALHFGGVADEGLALGRRGRLRLSVSRPLLDEIEGVRVRKFRWPVRQARLARVAIQESATLVTSTMRVDAIVEEEPDNRILECALAAQAHLVVSGDRHLQMLQISQGIAIVSPREFLNLFLTLEPSA